MDLVDPSSRLPSPASFTLQKIQRASTALKSLRACRIASESVSWTFFFTLKTANTSHIDPEVYAKGMPTSRCGQD